MNDDNCCFKKCKNKVEISYYGKNLCDKHWELMVEKTPDEIKEILGIKNKGKK
jgi:hypothetical protein